MAWIRGGAVREEKTHEEADADSGLCRVTERDGVRQQLVTGTVKEGVLHIDSLAMAEEHLDKGRTEVYAGSHLNVGERRITCDTGFPWLSHSC